MIFNNPNGVAWDLETQSAVALVAARKVLELREDADRFAEASARCIAQAAEFERIFGVGRLCRTCKERGCTGH